MVNLILTLFIDETNMLLQIRLQILRWILFGNWNLTIDDWKLWTFTTSMIVVLRPISTIGFLDIMSTPKTSSKSVSIFFSQYCDYSTPLRTNPSFFKTFFNFASDWTHMFSRFLVWKTSKAYFVSHSYFCKRSSKCFLPFFHLLKREIHSFLTFQLCKRLFFEPSLFCKRYSECFFSVFLLLKPEIHFLKFFFNLAKEWMHLFFRFLVWKGFKAWYFSHPRFAKVSATVFFRFSSLKTWNPRFLKLF